MHHLGRGLVDTPSDFGSVGAKPSNPGLLDWLAREFVDQGWSLKQLHKTIMMSTAYRQVSQRDPEKDAIDPDNHFFWRKTIQRLEAEIIRDRILATSGQLNTKMFGPPTSIGENQLGAIVASGSSRSVYIQSRRSMPVSMLQQFDMPVMEVNCEKRSSSTISTQSLMLMNSDFILDQAEHFARRLHREVGDEPQHQVGRAWQLALNRPATEKEIERSVVFLTQQVANLEAQQQAAAVQKEEGKDDEKKAEAEKEEKKVKRLKPKLQALTNLCQSLMGSNEFLYVD
jgi:hypothetical protein